MADLPSHFFKFIRPGYKFNLSIPRSFLTNFNCGKKCSKVILRRGRHEWSVEIDDGVFGDGWRRFVKENGVEEFDFIVFKHQGNMVFEFLVFDRSTCEKEHPNLSEEMDVEERLAEPDTIRTHRLKNLKKRKRNDYASKHEEKFQVKEESGCTIKKATSSSLDNHPYFISYLKPCSFKKSVMYLPADFSIPNGLQIGDMILRDDNGRSWQVHLNKNTEKSFCIGRGLKAFLGANGLKEGDTFKFELIEKEKDKPPVVNFSLLESKPIKPDEIENFARKTRSIPCEEDGRPYFKGKLKPYDVQSSYLYLRQGFVRSNGLVNKKKMILKNMEDERSWKVELNRYNNGCCYIGQGWKEFRVAYGLKEGDRFKLEVVENGEKPIVNFCLKKRSIEAT